MLVYDGHPIPIRDYQDPHREPTQREVNFFNEALAERQRSHQPMSQASRNLLAQRLNEVGDLHSLFH